MGCVARVSRGACCLHLQGRNVVSHIDSCPSRFTKRRVYCLVRDIRIGTCEPLSYPPHFDTKSGSVVFLSTHMERIPIQAVQKPTRVPTTHCETSKSAHVDRRHMPELDCDVNIQHNCIQWVMGVLSLAIRRPGPEADLCCLYIFKS